MSFGTRLRSLRETAGLTQEELAFRAGLSPNAVGLLERGARRRPQPHTVRSLADALDLSENERASLLTAVPRRETTDPETPSPAPGYVLPSPPTPLVGRERELREVRELLLGDSEVRLLTLIGIGGVGKSRLALEAARASVAAGRFPDGVTFVALAPLSDPALVVPTIARSLGLRESERQSPRDALFDYLRGKRLLLVLDNFEHLMEAAPEISGLIESSANLALLLTSRAPLRVRGEQEYPVGPLALPESTDSPYEEEVLASPSGRLFAERARAASPSFEVTGENAPSVAAICRQLAGLPLALELAAANTRFLDPAALLSRLDRALSNAWGRDLPERQRTMRATLDWSHELVSGPQRALFRRLSVFAGGCSLEAAEAVGAADAARVREVLERLGELAGQSLVTVEHVPAGGTRYGMLEPVRQYAREKLEESGEAAATRGRHAGYFVNLAESADEALLGPDHAAWLERLEREHDNLREALRWARKAGDVETGLRLSGSLAWFWWMHGYLSEGRRWIEEFLERSAADPAEPTGGPARAKALFNAGRLAFGQGDLPRAAEILEESLTLYRGIGDEDGTVLALVHLGQLLRAHGDQDRAAKLSEEGLALSRRLGDRRSTAIALNTLGHIERHRGSVKRATVLHEESLALFREVSNQRGIAYTLSNLGLLALGGGDLGRALALYEESLSLYERSGDKAGTALVLTYLGDIAREQGDEDRAVALYNDALAMHRELGNERGAARALGRLAPGQ